MAVPYRNQWDARSCIGCVDARLDCRLACIELYDAGGRLSATVILRKRAWACLNGALFIRKKASKSQNGSGKDNYLKMIKRLQRSDPASAKRGGRRLVDRLQRIERAGIECVINTSNAIRTAQKIAKKGSDHSSLAIRAQHLILPLLSCLTLTRKTSS